MTKRYPIFGNKHCSGLISSVKSERCRKNSMYRRIVNIFVLCFLTAFTGSCVSTQSMADKSPNQLVWPTPPAAAKIKWIRQWSDRYDFGKPSEVLEMLVGKERIEKLRRPNGVVTDTEGNIYVADSEMKLIFVFDIKKNSLRFLGLQRLSAPTGLAIDNKRNLIFVADSRSKKVFGIDKNSDDIVMSIGGPNEFKNPSGLAYDDQRERLYITDTQNHNVKVFDKGGKYLFTIGQRGVGDGEFNFPSYLALDKTGHLYVVDSFNFRVQIFDPEGKFLKKFGQLGDGSGFFTRPNGIAVDSDGNIYVADAAFNNFQIFNNNGRLLLWVGNSGRKPGEFFLPAGLFIDRDDRIYVTDTFNKRVQVFQYIKDKSSSQ
jgi:DNA-binding beta-propeller fold protein YncE